MTVRRARGPFPRFRLGCPLLSAVRGPRLRWALPRYPSGPLSPSVGGGARGSPAGGTPEASALLDAPVALSSVAPDRWPSAPLEALGVREHLVTPSPQSGIDLIPVTGVGGC
eukprot:1689561-Pyramimonas_sp.AAC.1